MPTLSICIPTHDGRADVLDRLLGTIEEQLVTDVRARVEVCVSDNGSRDDTTAVLDRRRSTLPVALVTHRFERNDGFTPNLLKVMEIASGDFCWLLGSDDLIAPGAIAEVLAVVDAYPAVAGITLNRYRVNVFDPETKLHDPPEELPERADQLHVYDTVHDVFSNVGLLHDYISTQVVARELFDEVMRATSAAQLAEAKHFPHLLLLGRMVQRRPSWVWYPVSLVQHTTGTSALDEDLDHDFTSYHHKIVIGGGEPTRRARVVNRLLKQQYSSSPWRGFWKDLYRLRNFMWLKHKHQSPGRLAFAGLTATYCLKALLYDPQPLQRVPWLVRYALKGRRGDFRALTPEAWARRTG